MVEPSLLAAPPAASAAPHTSAEPQSFEEVYEAEFAFAWRNLRRLGVRESQLRDAAQDVFLVVHRRLADFEGRGTLRAWLYSIVVRVASQYRRTRLRKDLEHTDDPDGVADTKTLGPEDNAGQNEDVRLLLSLLDQLDEAKREVFVLSDLEGLTAPEVAELLELKLNTVYSRLRAARLELKAALERCRGPEGSQP